MSGGKAKAQGEKRCSEITEGIDKLTVAYVFETASGRLLDMGGETRGVQKAEPAPLPDDANGAEDAPIEAADVTEADAPPDPDASEAQQNLNF